MPPATEAWYDAQTNTWAWQKPFNGSVPLPFVRECLGLQALRAGRAADSCSFDALAMSFSYGHADT